MLLGGFVEDWRLGDWVKWDCGWCGVILGVVYSVV